MAAIRWIVPFAFGLLLFLTGCGGGTSPDEPPSGWEATETRMWKEGVDTSKVFRNLGGLSEMGVLDEDFALEESGSINQEQFENAIKQSLEELYRSNPEIVDSLFAEHAASELEGADLSGAIEDGQLKPDLLNEYQKAAFDAIKKHYRRPERTEGTSDIPYPDSLRTQENAGQVEVQMHVDTTGAVNAIEVVKGTHPTLDAIIMKAGTQTQWNPGYVRQGSGEEWKPVTGWGRMSTTFPAPR